MIGGFGLKSKDGAIRIVAKAIVGNDCNPTIMRDRVNMMPKVIPVKFDSRIHAEAFVRRHDGKHFMFPHKYNGFWCNMIQSPKKRKDFWRDVSPLFKVKRAIYEVLFIDAKRFQDQ